ncbi:hypothetical protein UlMin_023131 [Ulmus minor]
MEKMLALRSLYRSLCSRSYRIAAVNHQLLQCRSPLSKGLGQTRFYSENASHCLWNELPDVVISDVKDALSKNTDDKADKEVVANIFHAAEAVVEFRDMVMNLKMELDGIVGMSGEEDPEKFTEEGTKVITRQEYSYIEKYK